MISFYKAPIEHGENLHYERLMQFAEAVITQRPDSSLHSVLSILRTYISITQTKTNFHASGRKNEIVIKSRITKKPLAFIKIPA